MASVPGKLVIISGPSGAGKTTLVRKVFDKLPALARSISATTRAPRPGEEEGIDYFFLTNAEFERRRLNGEFLECCEVFGSGCWYGTLESEVTPRLASGKWVVLEIDVEGTIAVLAKHPTALTIFIRPDSEAELERRLRSRGTESNAAISRRLEVARRELAKAHLYQHEVINDDVDRAVEQICTVLTLSGASISC